MLTNDLNDDIDERTRSEYVQICEHLDIEDTKMNSTWETYRSIRNDHTLEVSVITQNIFVVSK